MPFKLHQSYLDRYVPSTRSGSGLAKTEGKAPMKARTEKLISAGTSAATAFGLGYLEGKDMIPVIGADATTKKGGVSVEVLGSAAILGLEFFGMTGKGRMASVLHDAAVGGLAYWAGVMGTVVAGRTSPGGGYIKGNAVRGGAPQQMGAGAPRQTMTPEELWRAQFR